MTSLDKIPFCVDFVSCFTKNSTSVSKSVEPVNMASLVADVTNSLWHAFNALDELKTGQVPKSKLKVLTANLGTLLQCLNVEKGLQDHRSTNFLQFEDYLYYLQKELFVAPSGVNLEKCEIDKFREEIEEMCWLVCRKQFLTREKQVFPDFCVYQLFRIFCSLAEMVPCAEQLIQVVLPAEEVAYVAQTFVSSLGRNWDRIDFDQIARVIPKFGFPVFLALLETRYAQNVEIAGLVEGVQELFDAFIKDVIKKGFLSKRGQFLPMWKDAWFVLQPNCLTYFSTRTEKEKRGEFNINSKCAIENIPEMPNARSNRFSICCNDKSVEFHATDQKTKLQWILALQTAIEHSGMKESYQKRLSIKRKAEREANQQRRHDEEVKQKMQQQLLEKQQAELEVERLARQTAEQQAQKEAALREAELKELKELQEGKRELEEGKKELEMLLLKERQAKRDEEIVRNLQARVLREEWEKREELEKLKDEQGKLLDEERSKREGLQIKTQENGKQLESALEKLRQLELERMRIDTQLKETKKKLIAAERDKALLEHKLQEAQEKMVAAERAKEVLEAKLKVRERSLIPVFVKSTSGSKLTSPTDFNKRKGNSPRQEINKNHVIPEDDDANDTD